MNFIKNNLLVQIILAIIGGIVLGKYLPVIFNQTISDSIIRVFVTFNTFFSEFLNFFIPLIIIGLIVPAIGNIGQGASKLVLYTAAIAYASTLFAGFTTFGVSMAVFPNLLANQTVVKISETATQLTPYFSLQIPPLLDIMSALFAAFIIGIGVSRIQNSLLLRGFLEFEQIVNKVIQRIIIPLLPLFIFGIFMNMVHSGEIFIILNVFSKIIVVIFIMHVALLLVQYFIAGAISKRNPLTALKTMLPAYFTALGTQSSAATIPVTLRQASKLGLKEDIIKLTIPLCATIHLAGSTMKIVACSIALMLIQGITIDPLTFSGFIFMLGIAMVAAPGVPGGAIMAAIGIIGSMLGFDSKSQALMISLYIAMDSFGTACNVTGDGAIAMILDKIFKNKSIQ
ncbi:dicarboxylate/amino acid:cation symporter [Flavobacterium agricola]|uniref:Dicarboxylate/amino acid:cation symporter n=1 Tax=Flavobacterium agricola TaxID=2870839 RepID=A0ABY6M094_9FLAO|nr:dicarboxylate/amino acid:cation symporter [Flavobacterium agricola]UYW00835.1 dicarboxylate/amino acid:cation symporter [Flavobacterium agricola]